MILHPPTLETSRLILRPFAFSDAGRVQELAGDRKISENALDIPYPYDDGIAEKWIASHAADFYNDNGITLAIVEKKSQSLVGAVGLMATPAHKCAEMGYWVGVPYWGNGYCTEAVREIINYGFETLDYHKIVATHLAHNIASGRVMEKAGMHKEGTFVDHAFAGGKFHTLITHGIINPGDKK